MRNQQKQAYARAKLPESQPAHSSIRLPPLSRRGKVDWVSRLGIGCAGAEPALAVGELCTATDPERIKTIWRRSALLYDRWCTQTPWELSGAGIEAVRAVRPRAWSAREDLSEVCPGE